MKLVLSGEGPTDLGQERPTANGMEFVPGPMARIIDRLLERHHTKYSLLDAHQAGSDCVTYVHETALAALGKPGSPLFPGVKFGKGTAFFTRNAQALGLLAFAMVACETGVPMVPRPKSEAWLLCALRPASYANCALLEDAPGNDASQNSLKKQLAALHGADPTAQEQADWVMTGAVDPLRIDMPSFNAFKQALHTAALNAGLPQLP